MLYDEAMEDMFHVLRYFEEYAASLEGKVKRLQAAGRAEEGAGKEARKAPAKKAAKKAAEEERQRNRRARKAAKEVEETVAG